jgi:hypothetical protein
MQKFQFGSSVTILGVVKGNPLQAQYEHEIKKEIEGRPITRTITGAVYRDSAGRARKDICLEIAPELSLSLAYVYDPIAKRTYTLNRIDKSTTEELFRAPNEISPGDFLDSKPASVPDPETEDLGQKEIAGIKCRGYRMRHSGEAQVECWLSYELAAVIIEKRTTDLEQSTLRLFDISRSEPDEKLFIIPDAHKTGVDRDHRPR